MVRALALLCLSVAAAYAQGWNVVEALRPGDRVRVEETSRVEHKGTIAAVTADSIALHKGNAEVSIARANVRRVKLKTNSRRGRNLAIGAGIGLAIGLVTDNTLGTYIRNESNGINRVWYYLPPIALFGGIGAAIGPYKTIYKAP